MPTDPSRVLLLLKLLVLTLPEKIALEKSDEIWCPLSEKNSQCASAMKQFQRANLRPFPGLNFLASLYLANIQPNSKLHLPHKNALDPLLQLRSVTYSSLAIAFCDGSI